MSDHDCKNHHHPCHKKEVANLNRISGQIEGVKKMIEERRYCPETLTQLRAIRSAIKSIELRILDVHLSSCVSQASLSRDQNEQKRKIDEIRDLIKRFE
ncbi:metal-sensitive transcriptional regulator [Parachlamydia sp.]|uniref:metal-sensitive transcriptional regulator n=1 Tax=Parachlamydia sp. TaxID=2052048 RepID=UPI003D0DEFA0